MSSSIFCTNDIRTWRDPQPNNLKTFITNHPAHFIPIGLMSIATKGGANPRIKAIADNVGPADSTFRNFKADIHLDTWADTCLYSATCTWLDVSKHSTDFQFGFLETGRLSKDIVQDVEFDAWYYDAVPKVIVWLSALDCKQGQNSRIFATATNVTTSGFKLHVGTWLDSIVYGATVHWIAVPSDRGNLTAGVIEPELVEGGTKTSYTKRISFDKSFKRPPRILCALHKFDASNGSGLRITSNTKDITTDGMSFVASTWADNTLYSVGASYLAIEDPPRGKSYELPVVPPEQVTSDTRMMPRNNMAN